jgi:hypothetical protein
MKTNPGSKLLCAAALFLGPVILPAQTLTQTFTLQSNWNVLYLEVDPANKDIGAVFTNLPVESVWTYAQPVSTAQFIQNPSEAGFNDADWWRWLPGKPPFLSKLTAVLGGRTYFLKLTNGPAACEITGPLKAHATAWVPDQYNLRSFPVDPEDLPTFKQYFQCSPAHYDGVQNAPHRPIWRFIQDGTWRQVDINAPIQAGVPYWVYCKGASTFNGPLSVSVGSGAALEFGQELEWLSPQFENLAPASRTVTLRQLGTIIPGLLACQRFNATNGYEWIDLPDPFAFVVSQGTPKTLPLAIRRSLMPSNTYSTILQVTDGAGQRLRLPVSAEKTVAAVPYAGLWMGRVTVNAVSEPHFGNLVTNRYANSNGVAIPLDDAGLIVTTNQLGTNLAYTARTADGVQLPVYEKIERLVGAQTNTPAKSEFNLRLLIHVDTNGLAHLLKEVVQLWRDGTTTNDAQGYQVMDKPGAYVLVTRDDLLGQFKGAAVRDGVPVGRRLSAIGFDFDGQGTNHLLLHGAFTPGGTLSNSIHLAAAYPLNPFRHKFHPDHDNLDARFNTITNAALMEAYAVTRQLQFEFPIVALPGAHGPDPAYTTMSGTYRETLIGLHKQPIYVQGTFQLTRASFIAELNPSPTP